MSQKEGDRNHSITNIITNMSKSLNSTLIYMLEEGPPRPWKMY